MTSRHTHQCCGQPCSSTTGRPSPAEATCQRTRSTRTSAWTTPGSDGGAEGKLTLRSCSRCLRGGERGFALLLLGQVLVRGAVAVDRQRHPLAGPALARRRPARELVAEQVEARGRLCGEPLVAEPHV